MRPDRTQPPWSLAACAVWLTATTAIAADPVPAELQLAWSAPPGCPQAADVQSRIAAALRRPTRPGGPSATRVDARITPGARGFTLVLETRTSGNPVDVRRLEDRRCAVLADATAVIVATAIDEVDPNRAPPSLPPPPVDVVPPVPGALAPETAPPEPPTGGSAPTADLSPQPGVPTPAPSIGLAPGPAPPSPASANDLLPGPGPGQPAAPPAPPRRLGGALRFAGLGDLGSTPGLAGGLTGSGGLVAGRWRLDLGLVWVAPRPTRPSPTHDVTVSIGVLAGQLRGCAVPRLGPVDFPVCLGFEAGAVRGSGTGTGLVGRVDWRPWLGVVASPALAWSFTRRLALVVQVDLVLPLIRPTFAIHGLGEVYRGDAAAGRAALGLEVKFP